MLNFNWLTKKIFFLFLCLSSFLSAQESCCSEKLRVALLPVKPSSICAAPPIALKELQRALNHEFGSSKYFDVIDAFNRALTEKELDDDMFWQQMCACIDFAIAVEIVDYEIYPYYIKLKCVKPGGTSCWRHTRVKMRANLKVLDLRCCFADTVMEEIFDIDFAIPQEPCEVIKEILKPSSCAVMPYFRLAHQRLARHVIRTVERSIVEEL